MKTGLLLVDIQNDYFPGGRMELVSMDAAAKRSARILNAFRDASAPIYHVQHLSAHQGATFFIPQTEGVEINELVKPDKEEKLIQKHFPSAFRETSLSQVVEADDIEELVICGAMSHMCIDATTRAAFDLGFKCVVVEDACATRDLTFHDRTVAAADVHAAFMAALSSPYAKVISAEEYLSSSPK
ncbi:MAG: cysteine hydrolase [Gammaproteobacteria bacterium]|nr:cysteine hydrolase [Gammaproteobacteria bacterium]